MPEKTKTKRPAQVARRSVVKSRIARHKTLRQSRRPASPSIAIFGDSIHRVSFKEKIGPEVFFKLSGENMEIENFEKIFNDLWKAYTNLNYLLTGEKIQFDLYATGLNKGTILFHVVTSFKKLIPQGFLVNVDEENGKYFFIIYSDCGWQPSWHALEVGPALIKLKKQNKKLHDLFISFLRALRDYTGLDLWDEGMMGSTLEYMDEHLLNMKGEHDEGDLAEYKAGIELYADGLPAAYAKLIRRAKKIKPEMIRRHAQRFKARHPIAKLISEGTEILIADCNIYRFCYRGTMEDNEMDYFLSFDSQANIIWNIEDEFSREHEEALDSQANEGIQTPCFSFKIDASLRKIDFHELFEKCKWPEKFSQYFSRAFNLMKKFNHE